MSELLKAITDKLDAKALKFGFKGTESVHVSLILTEDEQKEFLGMKWDAHYTYEIKNNVLHINYKEDLEIYCEDLEEKFNITKLEKRFGKFTYEDKAIYEIEASFADRTNDGPIYRAHAIDEDGTLYFIIWKQYDQDAKNGVFINEDGNIMGNLSDRSNACNWDDYKIEKVLF